MNDKQRKNRTTIVYNIKQNRHPELYFLLEKKKQYQYFLAQRGLQLSCANCKVVSFTDRPIPTLSAPSASS